MPITPQQFLAKTTENWEKWVEDSETEDPEVWDEACEQFIEKQEGLLQQANGHPSGRPRPRP